MAAWDEGNGCIDQGGWRPFLPRRALAQIVAAAGALENPAASSGGMKSDGGVRAMCQGWELLVDVDWLCGQCGCSSSEVQREQTTR